MLSWLFKKRGPAAAPAARPVPARGGKPAAARPAAPAAQAAPTPAPAPVVDEGPLLRAALGDDAALLRLAQSAQLLATKLAAVEALADEGALRQAERAFRSHDRKVHRLAKQRLEAAVTRRETQAQALALQERTRGLLAEALVPVNHLVEIDRAWAALPAQALTPELQQAHTTLRAELDAHMRAQEAALHALQRWTAEARRQLDAAAQALAGADGHGDAQQAARLAEALTALRETRPDVPATAALDAALVQAQQAAAALQAQLEQRAAAAEAAAAERAAAAPAAVEVDSAAATPPAPPAPQDEARQAARRQRLEGLVQQAEVALADGQLAVLQQRLQAIEHTLAQGHAAPPEALRARLQALQAERGRLKAWQQWGGARARDDLVAEAETLAGQTLAAASPEAREAREAREAQATHDACEAAVATEPPAAVEPPTDTVPAPAAEVGETIALPEASEPHAAAEPPATETGETATRAEASEAEVAAAVSDVAMPDAPAEASAQPEPPRQARPPRATKATKTPRPPPPPKLNLKQHADAIQSLRKRWKALDHQGAVASAEQWRRFDAALTLAHEPVAAQQAALKVAREDNLAAREALMAALESGPAAQAAAQAAATTTTPAAGDDTAAPAHDDTAPRSPTDWRACIAELDRFQTAWRKLGPVEHTVPSAARDALLQRLQATLARVEAPLQQARAAAAAEREQLIAQAERLLPQAGSRPAPDSTRQVRELQAAWAEHARRLPLPRGLETALWARFKAATDAVFTQREAAHAARDAELAANLAAAQALVERLEALDVTSPSAEIQRTLAEVDRAWRQGAEVPRGAVETLETRFHAARSAATELLNSGQQRRWQSRCDALAAHLALCEAREDGGTDTTAPDARRAEAEAGPDALPAPWQQALAQRWAQPPGAGPLPAAEVDELLLRLEAAFNLPSAPAWQAARQQLKLRALKDTMEGRTPVQQGPQQNAAWMQALLRQAGLDAAQRTRLQALVAALRAAQPGVLGLPVDKA